VTREAGQLEVPRIEKNIRVILGVALLSPLIGILGTFLGMFEAFQQVGAQGAASGPAELNAGIMVALITSLLGLVVAVPMYVFYLYFLGRAKRLVHSIERAGIEMVHMICDAREENEFASFRGEVSAGRQSPKPPGGASH
jgi:biopolymer transport protein ExbB